MGIHAMGCQKRNGVAAPPDVQEDRPPDGRPHGIPYPRRNKQGAVKTLSILALAVGAVLVLGDGIVPAAERGGARVTVWDGPGGDVAASSDYELLVSSGSKSFKPFTYYSYARPVDKLLDAEGKYIKLSFLALHSSEYKRPEENRDTYAHSWSNFDFAGGPVTVEVRIKRPISGITLPLHSCGVFPTTLGITAQVVGGNVIRFTLDKPAKIALVPNHLLAMEKLNAGAAKQAWEGYRNPLFLFARAPETDVPRKTAPGTLVVKPGKTADVAAIGRARVIYFEPGVHDYSQFNPADPEHYITLRTGQTAYLAGGAYVYAVFRSDTRGPVREMPLLRGRGTMSGGKQRWSDLPYRTTLEKNVCLDGIQITDPHNHVSHSNAAIRDVAVVGAWHGNTDGFTREVPKSEPYAGWHLDDCFVMAADTNLKVGGCARVRNYTVWQLGNAEPLWIRQPNGCLVDGLQVIAFNAWPNYQTVNISRGAVQNSVFRNITIQAPYVPLLFLMPSAASGGGPAYDNAIFENVVVHTPHIGKKSPLGASGGGRTGRVVFRNLTIGGVKVTAANCRDYFDIPEGVSVGKDVVFE